ncbi:MAG: DUF5689 domain-containing protein [Bacteroidales bacterium]|nr:DUF5689 domain-containing protein [Bacteroidales bacterium]
MKNYKIISGLLALFTMTVLLFSCVDDDFDVPPVKTIPIGKIKTIADLKTMTSLDTITESASFYGTVIMDDKKGNLYKEAYVYDGNDVIVLKLRNAGGIYQGDSIRVQIKGLKVEHYKETYQLNSPEKVGFDMDLHITKVKTLVNVNPITTTIAAINADKARFQGKLIKLENVQFAAGDTSATYADGIRKLLVEHSIQDAEGNTMIVRTSGYAQFANDNVPNGSGSLIAIAGRYINTMQLYIRNLDEVSMNGARLNGGMGTPEGTGEKADPYNVAAAVANNSGINKWVRGYIVGFAEYSDNGTNFDFDAPFSGKTNVLIADDAQERNSNNVLVVQLPSSSSAVRAALNLQDNAANKGKQVSVRGNLEAYFGQPGMKSTIGCIIDGNEHGETTEIQGFYEESFTSNISAFSIFSVAGAQEWTWASYGGGCAKMSSVVSSQHFANQDWLVSPLINLSTKTNVKLILKEAINFITSYNDLQVLVSTDYDGSSNPSSQGTWTALSITSRPAGNSWDFQSSGDIDLSAYDGQATFYIAFKYLSTASAGAVWEIGNVLLREAN